jgi:hypothetical protein
MSTDHISLNNRDSTTLKQFRSTVKASLEQLSGIETRARVPPTNFKLIRRAFVKPAAPSSVPCTTCTTCGTPGCDYTECPHGHYVFDDTLTSRPLAIGELYPPPASWRDLHRATLQGVLRVVGLYYRHLHTAPRHLEHARLIVTNSLGLSDDTPVAVHTVPVLLQTAITEVTARIRADPLTATIPGLFNSLCDCYHTPVFGISLVRFKQLVQAQVSDHVSASSCLSPP